MFESVRWITRPSAGAGRERKRQILRLLSSRRCGCGCNSCEQADEFRWILTQSQPSASPSDTDRKTETLPMAHHSARLSADGFSVRLSCEIQTCEGLSVPRENEEWGRPRFLWRVFRVPHSLETLHHERRTGMCVVVYVCVCWRGWSSYCTRCIAMLRCQHLQWLTGPSIRSTLPSLHRSRRPCVFPWPPSKRSSCLVASVPL